MKKLVLVVTHTALSNTLWFDWLHELGLTKEQSHILFDYALNDVNSLENRINKYAFILVLGRISKHYLINNNYLSHDCTSIKIPHPAKVNQLSIDRNKSTIINAIDFMMKLYLKIPVEVELPELHTVIGTRLPQGLFYSFDSKVKVWVAVDNTTREAWTEEFDTKEKCISWLNTINDESSSSVL